MGIYDSVLVRIDDENEVEIQLKCWEPRMQTYRIGDEVPQIHGLSTYSIACLEGGFLNVFGGTLNSYTEECGSPHKCFDKYGDHFVPDCPGCTRQSSMAKYLSLNSPGDS